MKIKPDRAKILRWIVAILILGSFIWTAKTVNNLIEASNLNIIKKDLCSYTPEKSVIVFVDTRALKSMKRFHVTPTKIVAATNKIFADHGLPSSYNLKNIRIRIWNTEKKECNFLIGFSDEVKCSRSEMRPRYTTERKSSNPDVLIFITATGISEVSGNAFWKSQDGNGTIVINLGVNLKSYDSDKKLSEVARKFFLRRFAHLLAHEQTHLYGIDHSLDKSSIMCAYSNSFGDRRVRFDKKSMDDLIIRDSNLNKIKNQCAAQK